VNPSSATVPTQGRDIAASHSLASTLALHLAPGAVFAAAFVAAAPTLRNAGIPPITTFCLAVVLVLIPLELGYLLLQGRRRNGRLSLDGVVLNREPMSPRSYALWIPLLFVVSFALFNVFGTLTTESIRDEFFGWVPAWQSDPFGVDDPDRYGSTAILVAWVAALAVNGIAGPLVEELYFRGHLLPRLARLGRWAPVVNSALFALYHFVSPWQFFARALGLLPLFYFVWRRSNIYVGIAVHCALNTLGAFLLLPRVLDVL